MTNRKSETSRILLYQTADQRTRIEVRLEGETVWLTQAQLAELFQTTPQNITQHLRAIYGDGELDAAATCKEDLQVRREGGRHVRRALKHYNLDAVVAVGYRVRSHRGIQFRQWATERLREYIVKGFALDDERLKQSSAAAYFDELLERIRDIRSSERMFYRKVLDIYATSIDYDPRADMSQAFFATIQNKMHWATHGHTAAEIVALRADADQPNMGLTSWTGDRISRREAAIAKNYLSHEELGVLNRIVSAYLEFAELQAMRQRPMTMRDWITKLDEFLRLSDHDILAHAGTVSHDQALRKAETEYERFHALHALDTQPVDRDFEAAIERRLATAAKELGAAKSRKKDAG